jgi:hypothetical protein
MRKDIQQKEKWKTCAHGQRTCGAPKGGGGNAAGLQPLPPQPNFKNTEFVDTRTLNVLRDVPLSRKQPLESADY